MPIPKPSKGESQEDFHSKCMSAIVKEYGQNQANAICYSTWRESSMKEKIIEIKDEVQIGEHILEPGDKIEVLNEGKEYDMHVRDIVHKFAILAPYQTISFKFQSKTDETEWLPLSKSIMAVIADEFKYQL